MAKRMNKMNKKEIDAAVKGRLGLFVRSLKYYEKRLGKTIKIRSKYILNRIEKN
jgi:hypothetical protein